MKKYIVMIYLLLFNLIFAWGPYTADSERIYRADTSFKLEYDSDWFKDEYFEAPNGDGVSSLKDTELAKYSVVYYRNTGGTLDIENHLYMGSPYDHDNGNGDPQDPLNYVSLDDSNHYIELFMELKDIERHKSSDPTIRDSYYLVTAIRIEVYGDRNGDLTKDLLKRANDSNFVNMDNLQRIGSDLATFSLAVESRPGTTQEVDLIKSDSPFRQKLGTDKLYVILSAGVDTVFEVEVLEEGEEDGYMPDGGEILSNTLNLGKGIRGKKIGYGMNSEGYETARVLVRGTREAFVEAKIGNGFIEKGKVELKHNAGKKGIIDLDLTMDEHEFTLDQIVDRSQYDEQYRNNNGVNREIENKGQALYIINGVGTISEDASDGIYEATFEINFEYEHDF